MTLKNIGASVRTRIHNKAKADQVNTQFLSFFGLADQRAGGS